MRYGSLLIVAALGLAACSESPQSPTRLSEVETAEGAGAAAVAEGTGGPAAPQADPDAAPEGGMLGYLKEQADAAKAADAQEGVEVAALAPQGEPARSGGGGGFLSQLFGGGGASVKGPELPMAVPGKTLPFGEVARSCVSNVQSLGTATDRYPETGSGYTLIDTEPGNPGMRTFYLTGFRDGCARQFTAALAMFGSPETHEQIRYGPAAQTLPATGLDSAYEAVKNKVCRVATGEPCGNRMGRLARDTAFVSIYQRFGGNRRKDLLLHDGEVVAIDTHGE